MAEVLEGFPETAVGGRKKKYQWDVWLDGRVHKLVRGEDFPVSITNFKSQITNTVRDRNLVADVRLDALDKDVLYIQAKENDADD
jgi:hypothetical protein